ncbi:Bug family tripartite tricarboxylate transporter substrate binding protein [Ottowia sp. VDI28]|uniref:Bug family tripartite tricarboxylate transporter substrate binding protein n=1 Tax=Ottowia sp. VDI28 TaxID=3133968 RepID=UPI003C2FC5EB
MPFPLSRACLALLFACVVSTVSHAAGNVEMVIPLAAGGAMDAAGRAVADEWSRRTQVPVVVLNKPGAGTMIGTRFVAEQAAADGHTVLLGAMAMTTTEFQKAGASFDMAELAPVSYVGWQVTVLYIRADIPANTLSEFVQWAKGQPQGVSFGSSGNGSTPHLAAEQLAVSTGIRMTHVPFAGSSAYIPALLGGHIDAVFDAPSRRGLVKEGKLKALLVGSNKPLPDWPELPTSDAAGIPGFRTGGWYGVFVPARTPAEVQKRINAELNAVLAVPSVREKFASLGIEPTGGNPAEFARLIQVERERLRQLVRSRNIVFN